MPKPAIAPWVSTHLQLFKKAFQAAWALLPPPICTLYALPPEIRKIIFAYAAQDFLEIERNLRPDLGRDQHELRYPDILFEWGPLVYPEDYPKEGRPEGLSNLEFAFYNIVPELYFESFQARLSFSRLVLVVPWLHRSDKDKEEWTYPSFGNELPFWMITSIRKIRYELDHTEKTCGGVRSVIGDEEVIPKSHDSKVVEPPIDPWCTREYKSFRESVMDLARAVRVHKVEHSGSHLDWTMVVEVVGICKLCAARIEDCDLVFEDFLGFKGRFVDFEGTVGGLGNHHRVRELREYRHPKNSVA